MEAGVQVATAETLVYHDRMTDGGRYDDTLIIMLGLFVEIVMTVVTGVMMVMVPDCNNNLKSVV